MSKVDVLPGRDEAGRSGGGNWEKTSSKISSSLIDKQYELAKRSGALGGKIIGAGGGGFLMFYVKNSEIKNNLRKEFISTGLKEVKMPFESEGSKIIVNLSSKIWQNTSMK